MYAVLALVSGQVFTRTFRILPQSGTGYSTASRPSFSKPALQSFGSQKMSAYHLSHIITDFPAKEEMTILTPFVQTPKNMTVTKTRSAGFR